MGVLDVRLGVLGGYRVAGLGFDELRAGLSSLYATALLFAHGAAYSVRCFVIARALCLLLLPPPAPHRVRLVCGCFGCGVSDGCRVAGLGFKANFVPDYRHHMWPRCCLLSAPITLLVVL